MRKLALIILLLAGCGPQGVNIESHDGNVVIDGSGWTKFTRDGHRWIWYQEGIGESRVGGLEHDPDCPCFGTRMEQN